jgi:hypothetical protein
LARQTNAEGRVQANMLMTRLYAKDFIISANAKNIEMVAEARVVVHASMRRSAGRDAGPGCGHRRSSVVNGRRS